MATQIYTAAELREIVSVSAANVDAIIFEIMPHLLTAAEKGEREKALYGISRLPSEAHEEYMHVKVSTIEARVIERLKSLGYGAEKVQHGAKYVPRGLADDDGNGPIYMNHVIVVKWW